MELWFLFIGYGMVWVSLFAYLVYVTGRIHNVDDAIREIRHHLEPKKPRAPQSDN